VDNRGSDGTEVTEIDGDARCMG